MVTPRKPNATPRLDWTEGRVLLLKDLWASGKSARLIAKELDTTRNSVIGKVNRLNLEKRKTTSSFHPNHRPGYVKKVPQPRIRKQPRLVREVLRPRVDETIFAIDDQKIPFEQRLNLSNLGSTNCHWPVGDPQEADFFYCGATAMDGEQYCACHYFVGHQRLSPNAMTRLLGAMEAPRSDAPSTEAGSEVTPCRPSFPLPFSEAA